MRVGTEMEGRRQLVVFFLSFLITIQLETATIFQPLFTNSFHEYSQTKAHRWLIFDALIFNIM